MGFSTAGRWRQQSAMCTGEIDRVALIFKVADVARAYEEWKERVDFIAEPVEQQEWGIKVAHFRDPDGTLLEIYEYL
ncbi:VOC family protein [Rossellomorea marisflavi]|uniref:VOC family protein n=1 Tax=Rossellomorea marisflavi TaxID=189381 RepID=UPI000AFBA980|nr:VOC family protein [Rossellomorea marisflavi]